jgi:hypothetical protein
MPFIQLLASDTRATLAASGLVYWLEASMAVEEVKSHVTCLLGVFFHVGIEVSYSFAVDQIRGGGSGESPRLAWVFS